MKFNCYLTCCLSLVLLYFNSDAQLYKIDLDKKIDNASLIVEGKVVDRHSFWNDEHTMIYTANKLHIYKVFKGAIGEDEIEIVTEGGSVGNRCVVVSEVLQLQKNETGMFFCFKNAKQLRSPITKNILYDIYSSSQGFLKYNLKTNKAYAPFTVYDNIKQNLYTAIKMKTGITAKVVDASFDIGPGLITSGVNGTATITSFLPDTVHGGALNDAAHNILTINGSGFGNSPSGSAAVEFKNGNDDNSDPDFVISYNSPYITSWTNTKIIIKVPDHAATGPIAVMLNDGTTVTSSTSLQVFYSVLNAEFDLSSGDTIVSEPRLMNTNGSGGYTYQFSTNTAGGGIDISTSPAKATFERAVTTWKEISGANFTEGSNTTQQKIADDNVNLVVFDNDNTGQDKMEDGVLEKTFSWFSACTSGSDLLNAQKTGFDILIRNNGVSSGATLALNNGPCFPQEKNYDLEMIILHELGHALNLAHINDGYEASSNSYSTVNPSKVMHYAILDYVDRRSPDAAAYQGALYTITPQNNTYGNCSLYTQEMQPLKSTIAANDECPSNFPASAIQSNTKIFFDLVHATSNKFKDPAFTQVNCTNTGTFVTNNAYYAFENGTQQNLNLLISGYTLVPSGLSSCAGAGIRYALYDVSSCPVGQNFPTPVNCSTFSGNGAVSITGLQTAHKYLLYFDGLRNTKASFSVTFNSDSTNVPPVTTTTVFKAFPNPAVNGETNVEIDNATGSFYEYALYDITGKLITTNKVSVTQSTQTFTLYLNNLARGVYVLRLADENGKIVSKTKILKL